MGEDWTEQAAQHAPGVPYTEEGIQEYDPASYPPYDPGASAVSAGEEGIESAVATLPPVTVFNVKVQAENPPSGQDPTKIYRNQGVDVTATFKAHTDVGYSTDVRLAVDGDSQTAALEPLAADVTQDVVWHAGLVRAGEHTVSAEVISYSGTNPKFSTSFRVEPQDADEEIDEEGTEITVPSKAAKEHVQKSGMVPAYIHLTMTDASASHGQGGPLRGSFAVYFEGHGAVPQNDDEGKLTGYVPDTVSSQFDGVPNDSGMMSFHDAAVPPIGSLSVHGSDLAGRQVFGQLSRYELHDGALSLKVKRQAEKLEGKYSTEEEAKIAGRAKLKAGFEIEVVSMEGEIEVEQEHGQKTGFERPYVVFLVSNNLEISDDQSGH